MDLKKYVDDAIRTESKIDSVKVDLYTFDQLISAFVSASELLDLVKKNVFYGKPISKEKWNDARKSIEFAMEALHQQDERGAEYPTPTNFNPRVFHGIVGIATEAGELVEALNASKNSIDTTNVLEEIGDISWYTAILVDELNGDWEKLLNANIAKLKARYPEKFTSQDAIERDVDNERKVLEQNT